MKPLFDGKRCDLAQWTFKVLLDIVAHGLQRRDIEYFSAVEKAPAQGLANQAIDADQKSSQRFAGAGGRGDKSGPPRENMRPSLLLRLCRRTEFFGKPRSEEHTS